MKTVKDYHIHSTYSKNNHGKSTIEEIAAEAHRLKLKEIAITDHGPAHFLYGIKVKKITEARRRVEAVRRKYSDMKIYFGVEANILSLRGDTDIIDEIQNNCDIILCGYHNGVIFKSFKDAWSFYVMNFLAKLYPKIKQRQSIKNAEALANAMRRYQINILTHPGDKIPVDIDIVAKAAEETDTMLEINDSHGHLNAEEIKTAAKYKVKFVIGSDAHRKENIGKCANALKAAKAAELDILRIVNVE